MNRKVCPCNAENWRIPADFSITHLMGYKQERANLACELWTQTIKGEKQGYQIGYFLATLLEKMQFHVTNEPFCILISNIV